MCHKETGYSFLPRNGLQGQLYITDFSLKNTAKRKKKKTLNILF